MITESKNIWRVELPDEFGKPPRRMSVSTLNEIESCPRKYALRRAQYPRIWGGYGYPPKPTLKSLEGVIVHSSIEKIIDALKQANCPSVTDEMFVKTMRSLNGYSGVLERQLEIVSDELSANPRLKFKVGQITDKLKNSLLLLREQLQSQVSKLTFNSETKTNHSSGSGGAPRFLPKGIHSEVELNARELEWYGKIDYMFLSDEKCEIADFKTGERKLEHIFQVKIYNMLWILDKTQNPHSIPVTKLTLSYKNGDLEIPPLADHEVGNFIDEVKRRTDAARSLILQPIPEAKPSVDNCTYCPVRQLCSAYWTQETQQFLNEQRSRLPFSQKRNNLDIEIELENSIAEHLWQAKTLTCGSIEPQTRLLIRFASTSLQIRDELKSGMKLRLLDANSIQQIDEELSVPTIGTHWQSEVFLNAD